MSPSNGVFGSSPSSLNGRRKASVNPTGDNGVAFAPVAGADSFNQGSSEMASMGERFARRGVGTGGGDRKGWRCGCPSNELSVFITECSLGPLPEEATESESESWPSASIGATSASRKGSSGWVWVGSNNTDARSTRKVCMLQGRYRTPTSFPHRKQPTRSRVHLHIDLDRGTGYVFSGSAPTAASSSSGSTNAAHERIRGTLSA